MSTKQTWRRGNRFLTKAQMIASRDAGEVKTDEVKTDEEKKSSFINKLKSKK